MTARGMAAASLVLLGAAPVAVYLEAPSPALSAVFALYGTAGWFFLPLAFWRRAFAGEATTDDVIAVCGLLASLTIAVALAVKAFT